MNTNKRNMLFDISTFQNMNLEKEKTQHYILKMLKIFSNAKELDMIVTYMTKNGDDKYIKKGNQIKIETLLDKNDLQNIQIMALEEEKIIWGISVTFEHYFQKEHFGYDQIANNFSFSVSEEILNDDLQNDLINEFVIIADEITFVTGFISFDSGYVDAEPVKSTLEAVLGYEYLEYSKDFHSTIRGYHWGNLLSKSHMDILGGKEYVLKNAPGFIKELKEDGIYLQLTKNINDYNDGLLVKLKEFLKPIIPADTDSAKANYLMYKKDDPNCARLIFD